jgi:succinyldiaminopimelate transaminase
VHLSPILVAQTTYPFVRLEEAKRARAAEGIRILDFGVGDPREPTDLRIREALAAALQETSSYPLAVGLPELRTAIAGWCARRFGVELDADREIIPTLGSKEAIFSFAQILVDEAAGKDLVLIPEPSYPVYERGAFFARAQVEYMPLLAEHEFLPDLDQVSEESWQRACLVWVNYPNNPTGAIASLEFYERVAELAGRYDFVLASDEAYSELWFDEPPPSALQVSDRSHVAVFNTLSKRSSMTGYRSGFVAASPELIAALRSFRPTIGTAPQEFVQRASVVAWNDEEHVERTREVYRAKRELLLGVLQRKGYTVRGSEATFYLWLEAPPGETSESFAERLLVHGVVVAPGSYLGPSGEGYVRLALVPDIEACRAAAAILEEVL